MQRVVVFGNPGAGKSTFARSLAAKAGLPYIALDQHFWKPGWVQRENSEFRDRVAPLLDGARWIVDGNYFTPLGSERFERADHAFWFDMPRLVCMAGVLGRMIRQYGQVRADMAEGCPERFDLPFLNFVWHYRARNQQKFEAMLAHSGFERQTTRFVRRAEAAAFLSSLPESTR